MTRRTITPLTAVATAAVVAALGLAGPASAAKPAAKRGAAVATVAPAKPGVAGKFVGGALGHPGGAGVGECRALAAAANAIVDQMEQDLITGRDPGYDQGAVVDGILDAGTARGCVFMHD